jgi:hypothetical protein
MIDFCLGCVLFTFGLYLRMELADEFDKSETTQMVCYLCIIVGVLLLSVSFLSLLSIALSSCRWAIIPTGYLALLTAIGALATGISLAAQKQQLFDYLEEHQEDIDLSDSDVETLKRWTWFLVYSSFFEFFSSLVRSFSSRPFYNSLKRVDGAFEGLLDEEARLMDEKIDRNRENIGAKYDGLRDHYRTKYSRNEEI